MHNSFDRSKSFNWNTCYLLCSVYFRSLCTFMRSGSDVD